MRKKLIIVAIIFLLIDCALITIKLNQPSRVKPIHKPKPNYKYSVFLTSDDGPLVGSRYLNQLILDYEVPITLFLVGRNIVADPKLEPMFKSYTENPYVILANHSYSHANNRYKRFYKNSQNVVSDFLLSESTLNITSHFARFPGRNIWILSDHLQKSDDSNALKAARKLHEKYGYKIFGWDYELRHNGRGKILKTAMEHYNNIKRMLKEGKTYTKNQIVVLMHDQMFTSEKTQKIVGKLILLLQDDNECKLKLLSEYKTE